MQDFISGSVAPQYGNRRIFSRSFLPENNRKVLKKACRRRNTSNKKVLDGRFKGAQARSWEARRLEGKQAWRLESLNTEKLGVIHSFKASKLHNLVCVCPCVSVANYKSLWLSVWACCGVALAKRGLWLITKVPIVQYESVAD